MQKILFLCLIALIFLFHHQLRYGKGGYVDDNKVRQEITNNALINQGLKSRNESMIMEIAGLKGSRDALEARSRMGLNLVKPGETLILLPGNDLPLKKALPETTPAAKSH